MALVLVIEDDALCQECYEDLLIKEGYQVLIATRGEEGITKISRHKPDLIILDLAIQGLSGRAFLGQLKRMSPHVPVVIVSGKSGMQNDPEIRLSQQVYKFFTKPVHIKELSSAVRQILNNQASKQNNWEGKTLGQCQLTKYLGSGGSGCVYKGIWKNTTVAVKLLPQNIADFEEHLARFHREAQLLQQIKHPNIITLLDIGYDSYVHYLVMEYFPGENLAQIIQAEQHLSVTESIEISTQVAQGMDATHRLGVIHRDLKPSNILYARNLNQVKIIDFGLVRKVEVEEDQEITQKNYTVGTPAYMSPEQCQGLPLDVRSDIYSMGVTLYQILTGRLPFHKATTIQTFLAHVQEDLQWPPEVLALVPASLCKIINKMVEKDPDNRYANMLDVIQALHYPTSPKGYDVTNFVR